MSSETPISPTAPAASSIPPAGTQDGVASTPSTAAGAPEQTAPADGAAGTDPKHPGKLRMPGFGLRSHSDKERSRAPGSPMVATPGSDERRRITFENSRTNSLPMSPLAQQSSDASATRRASAWQSRRRTSIDPKLRPQEDAYHDSRAATRREFKRRATTLQAYYDENPHLLPQLPFTFRHGFKRWKLGLLITAMVFDACIVPIILYYAMTFGGNVQGWITFAVVTAIWGGPAYVEFAIRSWRLIKKERFYRPLGVSSRWAFDITHWIFVAAITTTTALLIVGAAPHIVWIRILSLPGPALLLVLGASLGLLTLYSLAGWKAPFRISSTAKGEEVHPGVYYLVEDIVAVNAAGGLPFREGIAARYKASPIFRKMIRDQSLFWSIGAICMSIPLIVIVCVHSVKKEVAYGVGWATPFVWAGVWALITIPWVRYELHRETITWDEVSGANAEKGKLDAEKAAETPPTTSDETAATPTTTTNGANTTTAAPAATGGETVTTNGTAT